MDISLSYLLSSFQEDSMLCLLSQLYYKLFVFYMVVFLLDGSLIFVPIFMPLSLRCFFAVVKRVIVLSEAFNWDLLGVLSLLLP